MLGLAAPANESVAWVASIWTLSARRAGDKRESACCESNHKEADYHDFTSY